VAYIVACTAYAFIVSAILAFVINLVPGLQLRASEEAELLGMDDDQLGEFAYDYVEVRRDYLAWQPATEEPEKGEYNVNPQDRHGIQEHSSMFNGVNGVSLDSSSSGHAHTAIGGDRHGIAAEDKLREEREAEMKAEREKGHVDLEQGHP
jgi:Amt family ammonium transporter